MSSFDRFSAIDSLVGGTLAGRSDGYGMKYMDGQTPPTEEEIDAEIIRLKEAYDAQEYARKRKVEYPTLEELLIALYDSDDKAEVDAKRAAIKAKYPKPS